MRVLVYDLDGVPIPTTPDVSHTLFSIEASDLGWPPGVWPPKIKGFLPARGLEPDMDVTFYRESWQRNRDNDLTAVIYASELGTMRVEVFND